MEEGGEVEMKAKGTRRRGRDEGEGEQSSNEISKASALRHMWMKNSILLSQFLEHSCHIDNENTVQHYTTLQHIPHRTNL